MLIGFANNTASRSLVRRWSAPFRSWKNLALLSTAALLAGFVGPFGTYLAMPMAGRLAFWSCIVFGATAAGHATATLIGDATARLGLPALLRHTVLIVLTAGPVCLTVLAVMTVSGLMVSWTEAAVLYLQCLAVTTGVAIYSTLTSPTPGPPTTNGVLDKPAAAAPPRILDRLPPAKRAPIIQLIAQDHYVEVVTEAGTALVAMRFRDAVEETLPVEGLQVHRSHWVALNAIAGRCRVDGRTGLKLTSGAFVPVGRTFRQSLDQHKIT